MQLSNTLVTLALVSLCALVAGSLAKRSDKEIFEDIKKFDICTVQAAFSFVQTDYKPPRTPEEFVKMCKTQSEAFKCLKEKSKGLEPLIRRGAVSLANTRSRQHKKLCSNPNSDLAKKFLAGSKCAMDSKFQDLKHSDIVFRKNMAAVVQRNYKDSTEELKQLCCVFHNFKKDLLGATSASCPEHRAALEDLVSSIITEDLTIVCDDDEKLLKSCPKLEKLPIDKIDLNKAPSPSVLSLYAFATLGEPTDEPLNFE